MRNARRLVTDGRSGIESLELLDQPTGEPGPGEVRVRVLASGIGFADVMSLHGGYPLAPRPPFTPGYDLAGRIDKLGANVTGLKVGQSVVALNPAFGCQADYVCLRAELLVPIPDDVDPAEAVCLVLNYLTAHCMLHKKAQLKRGETVLIHAAAGGVGTALLQLGRMLDLKMYGTASASKHEVVRNLGGIPIDYKRQDFVDLIQQKEPAGIDAAFDPIGGANLRGSYRVVRRGGRVISYGFAGGNFGGIRPMALGILQIGLLNAWPDGKRVRLCATPAEVRKNIVWYRETLSALVALLSHGELRPLVGMRVPFLEAARAYRLMEEGTVCGKVVLLH